MVFVYMVRCKFTEPAREQAWNDWYGGPKIGQMLSLPHFRTCQRFRRISGTGRDYIALWTVSKPEAMTSPEYRSQWGFSDWTPYITDWSRDLFDGRPATQDAFAVPAVGALRIVSFEGMSAEAADAARAAIPQSGMMWLPIAGLDRHTPLIGLRVLAEAGAGVPGAVPSGVKDGIYRPLSEQHVTGAPMDSRERVN